MNMVPGTIYEHDRKTVLDNNIPIRVKVYTLYDTCIADDR